MMKKSLLILVSISFLFYLSGCSRKEEKFSPYAGIWVLQDNQKMANFLGHKGSREGSYCLDFNPEEGRAVVRFIFDPQVYQAAVQSVRQNEYRLIIDQRFRDITISSYSSSATDGVKYFWHFSDSKNYNPHLKSSFDGVKLKSISDIDDCVETEQADYRLTQEENETDFEPKSSNSQD